MCAARSFGFITVRYKRDAHAGISSPITFRAASIKNEARNAAMSMTNCQEPGSENHPEQRRVPDSELLLLMGQAKQ